MRTTLIGRWLEKNNKPFLALLAAFATLATATLIDASSSSQVEQLGLLAVPRTGHAATALADGRVLITGGRDSAGTIVATAEVFDPANQTSTAIGMLNTPRIDHTATLLADGRVLIAGGTSVSGALKSAEIFDPANPGAGFRVISATMGAARAGHTATRLHDGTVLIAGGDDTGTAEIFKPTTESFSSTLLAMAAPRIGHTATLFSDDSVLLAGGDNDSMEYFSSVDQTFTLDPQKMTAARTGHEAISLSDTRLLFFGGDTGHTIDEFNSSADTLTLKATMDGAFSSATLLANDKILVLRPDAAGLYAPDATDQATAFTAFDEVSVPGSTALLRAGQTATELSGDKKILVAGGENAQHQPSLQIATFNPARIWTDKDDYMPDEPVLLFGSGWKSSEDVYLYAVDSETEQWTYGSTETADAQGSFSVEPYFIVQMRHLGTLFTVSAVGAQSNMQAEVEFTDAVNFNSITVGSQTGTAFAGVASAVTYQLTANYTGSGANNDDPVTLSFVGWTGATPAGVTPSISPSSVTQGSPNSTLTLQTSSSTIVAGTYTFTVRGTTAGGQTKSNTGTLVVAPGAATKIALSGSTSNLGSGSTRALTATIQDANGNTVTSGPNSTLSVTFAKTAGTGTVTGLGSTNAVGGIATLTVTGNQLGPVTIAASGGGLAAGTGNPITFNVVAGAANKLALSGSTADLTAGTTRVLTATIQDVNGNTVTTGADSSLSVTFAKTAGTGTVTGLGSAAASAGIATLTVTGNAPGSITITASATGSGGALAAGTGNPITFSVVAGAASKLALSGSTGNLTAGATRVITATIQDTAGNTIATGPDSTLSVTFAKSAGAGNVSGLTSVNASAGVANITVTGTTAGSVTILASGTASGGPLAAGTGNPITFTVVASTTVDHFAFDPISSPQTAGTPFNVTITAQDAGNNTVIGYNGNGFKVKLTSTGALVGAPVTTPAFTNGVLTNQSVTITNTGNNFTITATDSPATGTSNSFQVNAGAPAKLVFNQQPTATTAGQPITPSVTVQIQDANSNLTNSTAAVGIAIQNNPSSGTLAGTTPVNAVNGVATFSDLSINKGGIGYTLQATSAGLTSATSTAFTINNPAPTLASILPTSGNISDTFDVVFNGTNYIQGVTTVSFGPNITVSTVTVNSSIKLTAHVTILSGAAVGPRNVSVTNPAPGGGTATLTNGFTVNNPATTTVVTSSSVNNTSTYGDSVTFTATVTGASTPTGSVNFSVDGGSAIAGIAGATTSTTATWTYTTSSLTAATHIVSASFVHSGPFQDSNGSLLGGQVVNKRPVTVTPDSGQFKSFGDNDPTLTYQVTSGSVVTGDSFSGALSRDAGNNVGLYEITQGTLSLGSNYDLTVTTGVKFEIKTRAVTVTPDLGQFKIYGENDPALTYQITSGSVISGDSFSGALTRGPGTNIGLYEITVGTLSLGSNYDLTVTAGVKFEIKTRSVTVTPDLGQFKIYGDNDPTLTYQVTSGSVISGDSFSGALSRDAGNNVGLYEITQGALSLGSNYDLTVTTGVKFEIKTRAVTVTPDLGQFKIYGENDPTLTDQVTSGSVISGDSFSGALTRDPGTNVGLYEITVGTLSLGSNYELSVTAGVKFEIKKRPVTVTPDSNQFKIYGDNDPALTYSITNGSLVSGDSFSGALNRDAGSNVGLYDITQGTLSLGSNYYLTVTTGVKFEIRKRAVTVTPDLGQFKIYGENDPTLTYQISSGSVISGDSFNGALSRDAGNNVGLYEITQGTLSLGSNYHLTVTAGVKFEIKQRPLTVTPDSNQFKIYGQNDPTLTYQITSGSIISGDSFSGALSRDPGTNAGLYEITQGTLSLGSNYELTVTTGLKFEIKKLAVTLTGMRAYNGTPDATFGILTVSNAVGTDVVTVASGTATLASKNVGTQAITSVGTLTLGGAAAGNYTLTGATGSVTINKLALTINAITDSRTYNGYADSSAAPQFVTLVGTDTGSAVQVFDSKNAGARTLSVLSYTINDGNGGNNYGPITTNTASGSISTLALTINAVTDSKTYDGYATSSKTPSFVTLVGTDTATAVQVFDSKNAGARTLSVSTYMITDGNGGANYGPVAKNMAAGSISTLALTINAVTDTKTFDNNTDSNKTPSFVTLVGTDTGTAVQVFDSKNAGTRTLSVSSYTITDGNSGNNYGPVTKNTAAGTINPAHTSTGVTSSKNPSALNESVTFTATVMNTDTSPKPTGTVTFTYTNAALNLSGTLGTALVDGSGNAMVSYAALPVNASVVKATYNNVDGNFVGGTRGQVTQNVSYIFVGFLQPIDNLPMTNSSKAGQTIPVKWQLKDAAGNLISDLGTLAPNGLTSGAITCGAAPVDVIEELAAPGSTVFRFDGTQFIYNWQTSKPWAGGCRTLQVRLSDGTSHFAQFTFK